MDDEDDHRSMRRGAQKKPIEGKEFFKIVKTRLSIPQFKKFLDCIKNLNQKQASKEETLAVARDIFGSDNSDLYVAFQSILSKHMDDGFAE